MYDRVLVPTDGSPGSEQVAEHAAELAATVDAELFGVYVVDESAVGGGEVEAFGTDAETALVESGEAALSRVADVAASRDVPVTTDVRRGRPSPAIVDHADEVDADVIVMGTHGRQGMQRYLLGSVTEHVLRTADRPLLAVGLGGVAAPGASDAERIARRALEEEGSDLAGLRDEPYRERSTWVVPGRTDAGDRVNVHVDVRSGDARVAHLDGE